MKYRDALMNVVEEVEYLLAKRRQSALEQLHLVIVHGHHRPGTKCMPGETVEQTILATPSEEYQLNLSPTGLLIVDCIARYHRTPLSASRIERLLSSEPFFLRHSANDVSNQRTVVRPRYDSIKVYIGRFRGQIANAPARAWLNSNPYRILAPESTDSNVVVYRLNVRVEIIHVG